ncbi:MULTISPECIES: hypothetical protein [unclassified Arthrobacter]|uniref:hypothetical protein n=1 Tax=unclassified Arthrobacter TaxID=235627 RepID=UPI002E0594DE|nr:MULTISPECIES: hypothetical protein [unclassified Arthrobacter]MEC5193411.1 hypothetical protein [Arthrobacter sp. MP_M4]MEC5204857.1 hypothetical protein [Arthrobacter sp. MP_M7]
MTSTIAEAASQTHDVQVRTGPAGKPLAIRHDGRIWLVDPDIDSQHWFGRDTWWDTRRSAAVGSGDLVSIEFWRLQVRSGTNSILRTVIIRRNPLTTHWVLESISDADETTEEE